MKGTFEVPCFLFPSCEAGGRMMLDGEGNPIQNGTWTANFDCIIPLSVTSGPAEPGRPTLYGHGLLGSADEVASGPQRSLSQDYKIVHCATDEIGMAESDIPTVIAALQNVSAFPAIPDRLQQGLLDELYLGRAMISSSGFTTDPAFHQDGTLGDGLGAEHQPPLLQRQQPGRDHGRRAHRRLARLHPRRARGAGDELLGAAATLGGLRCRSPGAFESSYPNEAARPLVLDLMQMLWDRGEPDGYAERMTSDPLPDTPAHQVLMNVALGDHQVTNYQSDVEARTIGACAHGPVLYPGRWPHTSVLWDVKHIRHYPTPARPIYYYDIGPIRESPLGSGKFIGTDTAPLRQHSRTSPARTRTARRGVSPGPRRKRSRTSSKGRSGRATTAKQSPASRGLHRALGAAPDSRDGRARGRYPDVRPPNPCRGRCNGGLRRPSRGSPLNPRRRGHMSIATSYPLLEVFWTILIFFGFVVWIWILFTVFADLFRRQDIGGWGKAGWIIFVVILPFLGVFVYVIAYHKGMNERSVRQQQAAKTEMDQYVRSVAGKSDPTQQIAKGEELLKAGAITQAEFDQIKRHALAS